MARGDLTDQEWERLEPLLPRSSGKRGRPFREHRLVINGMLWVARTGAPWRDLPERYGPWKTVYSRFAAWQRTGRWEQILHALQGRAEAGGQVEWHVVSIDSTTVRAHQHAAGARLPTVAAEPPTAADESPLAPPGSEQGAKKGEVLVGIPTTREALGRSRGGLTTKLHLATDGRGRPLALHVTEGQRHDSTQLEAVLRRIRVPQRRGRPRQRPEQVCLDKGYSYPRCRQLLRRKGLRHVIPERKDQQEQRQKKGSQGGRPPRFDASVYRERNWVERGINRLKQWRRIATRYEKRAVHYLGMAFLAAIRMWLLA